MNPAPPAPDLPTVAAALIARYGWQAVTEHAVVERVAARQAQDPAGPAPLARLCREEASAILFAACGADPASGLPDQAYGDLWAYLAPPAAHLALPPGTTAEDLIQATLLTVYQKRARCRSPQTFLAWARTLLRGHQATVWRQTAPAMQQVQSLSSTDEAALPPALRQNPPEDPTGEQELLPILRQSLDTDEERLWAICILLGLKRRDLLTLLEVTPAQLDVLAARVRRKLRASPAFRTWVGR